jgi:hypothetical protein
MPYLSDSFRGDFIIQHHNGHYDDHYQKHILKAFSWTIEKAHCCEKEALH